ncbi:MAG: hypothetical protein UHY90_11085 [Treponema sp.]|nr:iron transporter [Spirochaetia bacterium]MDD7458421.1 hypothetical protein [Spirochaetales bacterium]MDY5812664.1 hypothetical protein [Treponema sp.]MEE1182778.1 hypothetical protein [Treponema sp.]
MFHANDSKKGMGTLIVNDGRMIFHVSLAGKSIVNLFAGKAADAKDKEDLWLKPTKDKVTYADGYSETVNGFDIPVSKIGKDFDLALIGKKGIWYDHRVSVDEVAEIAKPSDGQHDAGVVLLGGTGKARIESPALLEVAGGKNILTVVWTSSNYDYMIVDGVKYLNKTPGQKSTFTFAVADVTKPFKVVADTTAMGNPHEIEYTIGLLF